MGANIEKTSGVNFKLGQRGICVNQFSCQRNPLFGFQERIETDEMKLMQFAQAKAKLY